MTKPGFVSILLIGMLTSIAPADQVWIEAESTANTNFPARHPFEPADAAQRAALSGGRWIGIDGRRNQTAFAEYSFDISAAGPHQLYARKFWKHGPFRWQIDGGAMTLVDKNVALLDRASLRKNVEANWVSLGTIDLTAGRHTLRIELAEKWGPAAFDCFLITSTPFTPRGALKPGTKIGQAPEGWLAFEPDEDRFDTSPIDLRHLNENHAGENGRLVARGSEIVHEDTGRPIRFWGVNARADVVGMDGPSADRLARQLAKYGVNVVRIHMPAGDMRGPDDAAIDRIQRFAAAMKRQGIYTSLSIYFPLWIKLNEADGFGQYKDQHPFGIVFFDQKFQSVYRSWFKELLTRPNPHGGGLRLCDDPAVAIVEMVNEDSLFFWTFKPYDTVPGACMAELERRFARWLTDRHGTLEAATSRWPAGTVRGDDFAGGRAGILGLWEIVNRPSVRAQDTATFLCDVQTEFFTQMQQFLRDECHYPGLTVASNWVTADPRVLGPLDKLSNTVADVMDRHGYYEGKVTGPRSTSAIDQGDTYIDRAAVRFDRQEGPDPQKRSFGLPAWDLSYNFKPSIISEVNWPAPNRFRAEMPLIFAASGSLQGTDGFMFFALEGPSWDSMLRKFSLQTPAIMGQFPAAALVYRRGDVPSAENFIVTGVSREQLNQLKGALVQAPLNLDELRVRDAQKPPSETDAPGRIDPLSFAAGGVTLWLHEGGWTSQQPDLSPLIDRQNRVVRSDHLTWDYGRGVITMNAPRAAAVVGFLGAAGPMDVGGLRFDIRNEFAAAWAVSLDGLPLNESRRLLLQVMTEEANNGFATSGEVVRSISSVGAAPVCVRKLDGLVTFPGEVSVTPLDFNGYPASPKINSLREVTLHPDTLYYLIER